MGADLLIIDLLTQEQGLVDHVYHHLMGYFGPTYQYIWDRVEATDGRYYLPDDVIPAIQNKAVYFLALAFPRRKLTTDNNT